MADEQFLSFLSRTPFFAALERPALALLEGMLKTHAWPAGATVIQEGGQGSSLYVVKSGTVVVYHQGPPGEPPVKLTRLGPGDFFGEMTLVEMQPRSASVVAESDAELLELRAADLYRLYKQDM